MNTSEIYMLTFPDRKVYIGQCNKRTRNNKKWGADRRLGNHICCANNKKRVSNTRISNAIREFGEDNIKLEVLLETDTIDANFYEEQMIEVLDATNPDFGYNTHLGGSNRHRQTEKTCVKMSESRRAYTPKPPSEKTKKKISKTNIKRKRYGHRKQELPMFLGLRNAKDRCGYRISEFHPMFKYATQKSFVTSDYNKDSAKTDDYNKVMDEKYISCIQELDRINKLIIV